MARRSPSQMFWGLGGGVAPLCKLGSWITPWQWLYVWNQPAVLNQWCSSSTSSRAWTCWPQTCGTVCSNCATQLSIVILVWTDVMKADRCLQCLFALLWFSTKLAVSPEPVDLSRPRPRRRRRLCGWWSPLGPSNTVIAAESQWWLLPSTSRALQSIRLPPSVSVRVCESECWRI